MGEECAFRDASIATSSANRPLAVSLFELNVGGPICAKKACRYFERHSETSFRSNPFVDGRSACPAAGL